MKTKDVIIIGGGPAGISASIWLTRLGIDCLLLEKNIKLGGQLHDIHNDIIDYPGLYLKKGIELQTMFTEQICELGCNNIMDAEVLSISPSEKKVILHHAKEIAEYKYRYLIIATGAKQKYLGIPGEKEMILRGETYSASADCHLFKDKTAAVVGGGDRAVEGALLLADAGAKVHLIHRSQQFKARNQLLESALANPNIKFFTNTKVIKINGKAAVSSIEILSKDGNASKINVDAVFIRIGTQPNNELFKDLLTLSEDGFIVTDLYGKTTAPGIFAIGDICTKPVLSSISASAGQGAFVAKYIASLSMRARGEYNENKL